MVDRAPLQAIEGPEPQDAGKREARGTHQLLVLGHHQIFQHGHAAEQPDVLEGAGDAGLGVDVVVVETLEPVAWSLRMIELHRSLGRLVEAGDAVEHGGLAGAVRPDQRGDVLAPDIEGHVVDGGEPAEAHGEVLDLEQGFGLPPPHARPSLTRWPPTARRSLSTMDGSRDEMMPRGRHSMMPTMAMPNRSMR